MGWSRVWFFPLFCACCVALWFASTGCRLLLGPPFCWGTCLCRWRGPCTLRILETHASYLWVLCFNQRLCFNLSKTQLIRFRYCRHCLWFVRLLVSHLGNKLPFDLGIFSSSIVKWQRQVAAFSTLLVTILTFLFESCCLSLYLVYGNYPVGVSFPWMSHLGSGGCHQIPTLHGILQGFRVWWM